MKIGNLKSLPDIVNKIQYLVYRHTRVHKQLRDVLKNHESQRAPQTKRTPKLRPGQTWSEGGVNSGLRGNSME